MDELVFAVMPACVVSEAVTVRPPAVLSVTLKFCVPATNAALLGKTALASLEVMATVSLVLIKFQFASTALTVTGKAVHTAELDSHSDLVFPLLLEKHSPGARISSFAKV